MCVIMLVDNKKGIRPTDEMVQKAWARNPHGVGIAWREGDEIVWEKGLDFEAAKKAIKEAPLPYVVHFRHASPAAGSEKSIKPSLCHPFPIAKNTNLLLKGRTKGYVLFHNGNWSAWEFDLKAAAINSNTPIPTGKWTDSRAMAFLCAIYGLGFMELLTDQKGLAFGPKYYEVFSGKGWYPMLDQAVWCSNDDFLTMSQRMFSICQAQWCRRTTDLDMTGYCPDHRDGGGSKGVATASSAAPFQPSQGNLQEQIVDLVWAEKQHQERDQHGERKISKGKIKEIREGYDKLTSPSPKQQEKGRHVLVHLTKYLIQSLGPLPNHALTKPFPQSVH